jgi:hypothetical protein
MKKLGKSATGQLKNLALAKGFSGVAEYLEATGQLIPKEKRKRGAKKGAGAGAEVAVNVAEVGAVAPAVEGGASESSISNDVVIKEDSVDEKVDGESLNIAAAVEAAEKDGNMDEEAEKAAEEGDKKGGGENDGRE